MTKFFFSLTVIATLLCVNSAFAMDDDFDRPASPPAHPAGRADDDGTGPATAATAGSAAVQGKKSRWEDYFEVTKGNKVSPLVEEAMEFVSSEGVVPFKVLDMGAGAGRDTEFFLSKDWTVQAFDYSPASIQILENRFKDHLNAGTLTLEQSDFETFQNWHMVDMVNASFSLPFCNPEEIRNVFGMISAHTKAGGLFVGQLFDHPNQVEMRGMNTNHFSEEEVMNLLAENHFDIVRLSSRENIMQNGENFPWKVHHIIARKAE